MLHLHQHPEGVSHTLTFEAPATETDFCSSRSFRIQLDAVPGSTVLESGKCN